MGLHATLSASGSKRWINCPGSIRMSEGRESTSSQAARLGTAAHGLGEYCLKNRIEDVAATMVGGVVYLDENEDAWVVPPDPDMAEMAAAAQFDAMGAVPFPIDDNMADSVQVYVDTCLAEVERLGEGAQVMVEERFRLADDMFGTNDCSVLLPFEHLTVLDLKHGQGVIVEVQDEPTEEMVRLARLAGCDAPRGNSQLLYYALGIAKKVDWAFNTLDLVIVQPRARHEEGGVRRYSTTVDELQAFEEIVMQAAANTKVPDAPLNAGDWCGFCPAAGACPRLRDAAHEAAGLQFSDGAYMVEKGANEMTDAEVAQAAKMIPILDAHIKAVRGEVMTRLRSSEDGTWQGSFKLVRGKANRKWGDANVALKRLSDFGFFSQDLYERKPLTPAKVEKLRPDHFKDLGIKPKDIKAVVAELAVKPEGKIVVAPIDDPRDAVPPTQAAAADFATPYEGEGDDE